MGVEYYEWGVLTGGTPDSGGVIPAAASYGPPETFDGTVAVGGTTIAFTSATKDITIRNTHDTAPLEYSLDGGTVWHTLLAYGVAQMPVQVASLMLQRVAGAAVTYEIVAALS